MMMNNRRSIRLKNFDYSQKGYYFVTIAVQNKWKLFWNIVGADSYIRPTKSNLNIIRPFESMESLNLIIPNEGGNGIPRIHRIPSIHEIPSVHGINERGLMIEKSILEIPEFYSGILINEYVVMPDHIHFIININGATISLSEIIQRFKILSTNRYIDAVKNHNWPKFNKRLWQRNYYEKIIKNKSELEIIRKYIQNNPKNYEYK